MAGPPRRRSIFAGRVVDLGLEVAVLPDGREVELEIIRHPGASAVVPIHDDGTVTLVHQHRHAAGGMIYEVPAGLLEAGEAPAECARRELAEEAGLDAASLELLSSIHTTPGFTDEVIHVFLARGLEAVAAHLDADEYLEPARIPLEEAMAMIDRGAITDGKTIAALCLAERRLRAR